MIALVVLLLRRPADGAQADSRLAQLPETIARLEGKTAAMDSSVRESLALMRKELNTEARSGREELHSKLTQLSESNVQKQDQMRAAVSEGLRQLNEDNTKKLDQMRQTVDEKLNATLQTRLTESFSQVTDQLTKVHSGLGEMSKLSDGVQGLSRIFSNVKARGGIGEVELGRLLADKLAPGQFLKNVTVKPGSREAVEYAVKFPSQSGETLMAIDSKFPQEDWERLEAAYESGDAEQIKSLGRAFESAIRLQGKTICEKYIAPPVTTPHAIMFLPTEGLYAEVIRRDGLQAEIQSKYQVTIAGPNTLSAILTSFQMGFHMLAIQQKGDEVWKVLAATRSEFGKFGDLLGKMESQVGTVQNTIQKLGVRTRAIDRTLRDVGQLDAPEAAAALEFDTIVPGLAEQTGEEDE